MVYMLYKRSRSKQTNVRGIEQNWFKQLCKRFTATRGVISHKPLQWRHNGRDVVSNHQPHDCLFNHLFRRRSKKTSKLRVTGLCAENSPVTGEFPAQWASNAENVSISWRHYAIFPSDYSFCAELWNDSSLTRSISQIVSHNIETEFVTNGSDMGNAWLTITATKCHVIFISYITRRFLYLGDKCNI